EEKESGEGEPGMDWKSAEVVSGDRGRTPADLPGEPLDRVRVGGGQVNPLAPVAQVAQEIVLEPAEEDLTVRVPEETLHRAAREVECRYGSTAVGSYCHRVESEPVLPHQARGGECTVAVLGFVAIADEDE